MSPPFHPEGAALAWKGLFGAACFLLLWAVQTAVCLGMGLWYAAAVGPAYRSAQTALLAFYRVPFLHTSRRPFMPGGTSLSQRMVRFFIPSPPLRTSGPAGRPAPAGLLPGPLPPQPAPPGGDGGLPAQSPVRGPALVPAVGQQVEQGDPSSHEEGGHALEDLLHGPVNPNTVQKAYRLLEEAGLIASHAGAKSYVSASPERIEAVRAELLVSDVRRLAAALRQTAGSSPAAYQWANRTASTVCTAQNSRR